MPMVRKRRKRRKNIGGSQNQMPDKNERFVLSHTAAILIGHLDRFPVLDEEALDLIWVNHSLSEPVLQVMQALCSMNSAVHA